MKKKKIIFIISILIVLFIIGFFVGSLSPKKVFEKEILVNATCGSYEGINKDREPVLQFGTITPGVTHIRGFNITNDADHIVRLKTSISGTIKKYSIIEAPEKIDSKERIRINMSVTC
ncbi:hypothetical protein GF371_02270, partial [Candidatus Woesearchaeota archaeon]|nr:hypothetical protein [Candidatus Woesearchaeota archaeon]